MNHKMIFIEGLPGTGKTTLSEKIFEMYTSQGIQAGLLQENDAIPSNLYNVAGILKNDFASLQYDIDYITKTENYVFVNLSNCSVEAASQLQQYNLGDPFNPYISAQEYARSTLEWWQYWVDNNLTESVFILDSAFMQCPINNMIYRKAAEPEINAYIQAIAEIIKPFNPFCIYLCRENAKISMDFAKTVKSEQWAKRVDKFLADLDCLDVFDRRFDLERTLVALIPNIVCYINDHDWSDVDAKIQGLF
ncbi:MAG: hypothetical protein FWD03_03380 [Defluviitaleaceae bacterium]|nr:hypothetical protein [Defluviitaleaceae bacterium]